MRLERFPKGAETVGNQRTNWSHPNDSIVEIGENAVKSPEDMRRLSVAQTPMKDHQLTLVLKTLEKYTTTTIIIINNNNNNHVVPLARISLTLSRHFSLSFIASGRSSGLHPVSSHSCCMYVRAGSPAFARPHVGVHRSTSLKGSSLLLQ